MILSIQLFDFGRVVWEFDGDVPISRRNEIASLLTDPVLPPGGADVLSRVRVRESRIPTVDQMEPSLIRKGRGLTAFSSPSGVKILINPEFQPDSPRRVLQLTRIVLYGFLPLVLSGQVAIIHGALLCKSDEGVLLTGCSGAGKSTCARRVPEPWEALCDDMVLVTRNGNRYYGQALPTWSQLFPGRSISHPVNWNRFTRLHSIFQLEHAGRADSVSPLTRFEQVGTILAGLHDFSNSWEVERPNGVRQQLLTALVDFSVTMARYVPVAKLKHALDGRFWQALEEFHAPDQYVDHVS